MASGVRASGGVADDAARLDERFHRSLAALKHGRDIQPTLDALCREWREYYAQFETLDRRLRKVEREMEVRERQLETLLAALGREHYDTSDVTAAFETRMERNIAAEDFFRLVKRHDERFWGCLRVLVERAGRTYGDAVQPITKVTQTRKFRVKAR